jgi:penicillin amidase
MQFQHFDMRIIPLLISGTITIGLIVVFNQRISVGDSKMPPLGKFLSPQQGFWQNAEVADDHATINLRFPQLKGKVDIYFDERMVPHVFAENDEDLYFAEGYLHARFRLWQMEFQTHAAAGRLAEILGAGNDSAILNNDRKMRRLGMVTGARQSLAEMENDSATGPMINAYTAGVNAYIDKMTISDLPIEYRLLNYYPEHWNNLKTALFLKYMSYDLTGHDEDIEYTNLQHAMSADEFEKAFPISRDSLDPIVPRGTVFPAPSVVSKKPAAADSGYFEWQKDLAGLGIDPVNKPDKENGSNNWAVDGSKTQSGRPILCNDPHLGLNLPALWYEMQLHSPSHNVYGVSFPGAPGVIIGFNDSCAWGVTNAGRDVKDYYRIRFKDDATKQEYWFDSAWKSAIIRIDTIRIRDGNPFYDTVANTVFGPVMFDRDFTDAGRLPGTVNLAVRWKAQDGSNELKTFYLLNRARNYQDYLTAIKSFTCPGQNFAFADKNNEIALWQQGVFPAKWRRQGDFVMPGEDSSYMWQDTIPMAENPHLVQPQRGFVSSANQQPADSTYPYYLGGSFDLYRGMEINRRLSRMFDITPQAMQRLQTENYNLFAETILPLMVRNVDEESLDAGEMKYFDIVRRWNLKSDATEKGPVVFQVWFDSLEREVWFDEFNIAPRPITLPDEATLAEALKRDSAFSFIDNINTPNIETLPEVMTTAFKKAAHKLEDLDHSGRLEWWRYKDIGVRHLLRLPAFSRFHIHIGGGEHIINATATQFHGPSWRMIVHLTDETEAYGIFPGGQSGNPGSKYYDNSVSDWAAGKYNTLWMMKETDVDDKRVVCKITLAN